MLGLDSINRLFNHRPLGTDGAGEEDCSTEEKGHGSDSSEPIDQSQVTTREQAAEVQESEAESVEGGATSYVSVDVGEEPAEDEDSSSRSVDSLMADWQEDLEAFKQMEKDEL